MTAQVVNSMLPNKAPDKVMKAKMSLPKEQFSTVMNEVTGSSNAKEHVNKTTEISKDRINKAMNATSKVVLNEPTEDLSVIKDMGPTKTVSELYQQLKQLGGKEDDLSLSIQDMLKEILDISDEELTELMAESGLVVGDLLHQDNLVNLVLQSEQASDIGQALINEELADKLQSLYDKLNEIVMQYTEEVNILMPNPDSIMSDPVALQGDNKESSEDMFTVEVPKATEDEAAKVIIVKEQFANSTDDGLLNRATDNNQETVSTQANQQVAVNFLEQVNAQLEESLMKTDEIVSPREIVDQIVNRIKISLSPDQTSMELLLNPEHLGSVHVTVAAKNGLMTAQFAVGNEAAKEAIEASVNLLKQQFEEQGIKVNEVEVTISNYSHQFNSESESQRQYEEAQSKKRAFRYDAGEEGDMIATLDEVRNRMYMEESSVNYTA